MDIIIISNAKEERFRLMTQNAIDSALETTQGHNVRIIVVEQQSINYNVETIHYDFPFNYNRVANFGARHGNNRLITISNNDITFHKGWIEAMLKADKPVMSPVCPLNPRQRDLKHDVEGNDIALHFSGWCFTIQREIFNKINGFDEDFGFWYADDATVKQLNKIGITPTLIVGARATHLISQTLNSLDQEDINERTHGQTRKFKDKYLV